LTYDGGVIKPTEEKRSLSTRQRALVRPGSMPAGATLSTEQSYAGIKPTDKKRSFPALTNLGVKPLGAGAAV
jgi:hypothetical protein